MISNKKSSVLKGSAESLTPELLRLDKSFSEFASYSGRDFKMKFMQFFQELSKQIDMESGVDIISSRMQYLLNDQKFLRQFIGYIFKYSDFSSELKNKIDFNQNSFNIGMSIIVDFVEKISSSHQSSDSYSNYSMMSPSSSSSSSMSSLSSSSKLIDEFIISQLISKSNLSSLTLRIGTVMILNSIFKNDLSSSYNYAIKKILTRYCESFLNDMLSIYFNNKGKRDFALSFMKDHLKLFFSTSKEVSQISHEVLSSFLLKHPKEFILLLETFQERLDYEPSILEKVSVHFALFLKKLTSIEQNKYAHDFFKVIERHLNRSSEIGYEFLKTQNDNILSILKTKSTKLDKEIIEKLSSLSLLNSFDDHSNKIVDLKKAKQQKRKSISSKSKLENISYTKILLSIEN